MDIPGYTVRAMRREDLDLAVRWAAQEGWNPGLRDAACFWEADPEGFFVGLYEGEPVAVIAAVNYGGFGFVGLYIVRPDMRGRGYGHALWRHALARLDGVTLGLDAVTAQEATYARSGFVTAHASIRFCWDQPPDPCVAERLVPLEEVPLQDVLDYEAQCFPAARAGFMRCWTTMPNARGLAVVRGGEFLGFGVVRTCEEGSKIGPLFAEDCEIAETLLLGLGAAAEQTPVFLDVPETNVRGVHLAAHYGMTEVFRTVRMYRGPEPDSDVFKIFGVTSFELG